MRVQFALKIKLMFLKEYFTRGGVTLVSKIPLNLKEWLFQLGRWVVWMFSLEPQCSPDWESKDFQSLFRIELLYLLYYFMLMICMGRYRGSKRIGTPLWGMPKTSVRE